MCFNKRSARRRFRDHGYRRRGPGSIIGFIIRAFILKFLWNMLIPSLFGGPFIGFFHAVGLLLIGKVISGGRGYHEPSGKKREWKRKMKEKMEKMSPEERREFKEKMLDWEVNIIEVEVEDEEEDKSKNG
ncbi:MAG: hypothetical protein AAF696_34345 [Bacteroidota bacterium]